jgi:hypothetical protein
MGILDDAIREHLDLKRKHGAREDEVRNLEDSAFGAGDLPDPFVSGDLFGQSASQGTSAAASTSVDTPPPVDSSDEEPTRIVEPPTGPQAQEPDPSPPSQAPDSAPTRAPEPTPPPREASASAPPEAPEQAASSELAPPGQVPLDVRETPAPFDFDAAEPPDAAESPDVTATDVTATEPPDTQASATQHAPAEPVVEDVAPAPAEPAQEPEPPPPAPEPEPSESLADLLAEEDLEPQAPDEVEVAETRASAPEPPPPPPPTAEGTRPQDTAMSRPIPLPDETRARPADSEAPSEPAETELSEPVSPSPAAGPEPPGRARGRVHHETQEHPAPEPPSQEIEFDGPPSSEPLEPAGAASAAGVFDFEADVGDAGVTAGDEVEPAAEPEGPSDDFEELGPPTDERPFEPDAEPAGDAEPARDPEPVWEDEGSDEFPATEVRPAPETGEEDLLAESPDFVEESTDEEDLWFEKGPPKDFDFEDER